MTAPNAWSDFRQLYESLVNDAPPSVLTEWLDRHGLTAAKWFATLRERLDPAHPLSEDESWTLYAFSRVNETLLLSFQPSRDNWHDWTPGISLDAYCNFMQALGLEVLPARPFSPFHHEIVTVSQSGEPSAPAMMTREFWPALMLGPLLISRAGVAITAGRDRICKEIAESSTLYWTFWRRSRPVSDLSHGWGSNSQWRTSFRCDYEADGHYVLNADELGRTRRDGEPNDELTDAEQLELLVHRCFVISSRPHDDLYPFHEGAIVSIDAPPALLPPS